MTAVLNQLLVEEGVFDEPLPCLEENEVCLQGKVIPCESKRGPDACMKYLGCQDNLETGFKCDIPPPLDVVVPLPASGMTLGSVLVAALVLFGVSTLAARWKTR